jgi:hypothetical protein
VVGSVPPPVADGAVVGLLALSSPPHAANAAVAPAPMMNCRLPTLDGIQNFRSSDMFRSPQTQRCDPERVTGTET